MSILNSRFIKLLIAGYGQEGARILAAAVAAGLLQAGALIIVNAAAEHFDADSLNFRYFALFALCIVGFALANRYAFTRTCQRAGQMIYDTQLRIADKVRRSDLRSFESLERTDVYKVLLEHTDVLFEGARYLTISASSLIMLIASFTYIAFISMPALIICCVMIVAAVAVHQGTQKRINQKLVQAKQRETDFLRHLNNLVDGFKEVKISRARSEDLFENHLRMSSVAARTAKVESEHLAINNYIFAQTFFLILIAAIVFVLPRLGDVKGEDVSSVITVVLFTLGPLGQVVAMLPFIYKAEFALDSIETMENKLEQADDVKDTLEKSPLPAGEFGRIDLRAVSFRYQAGNGSGFRLGPLDLAINRGEILFIVGGNGSGKSTLLKLITGLYYPTAGTVYLDNYAVDQAAYAHYRDFFTIIFSDFHLFDRLYGLRDVDEALVEELLETMQLKGQTAYADGRFSNINLSSGQRRRLALITTYIENKPIFVFDEVAADLDPQFRRYFYEQYLPSLKAQGKTVVAVSHDDRFFHLADRVVKLEYGEMVAAPPSAGPDQGQAG
ncbi:MAG: cyclic peptide export ABC transporter [Thermodesulfobacteriota bacterium]